MALDLTGAREAFTQIFHAFTLRRGDGSTSPCGFAARGGVINEGDAQREKRWDCTITLPATTSMELVADEEVTIDEHPGRIYRIVHAPGPGVINLQRRYGAVEV